MDLGLDYPDEEFSIVIICACAYVILMWMTDCNDITKPIPRHSRDTERGFYLQKFIEFSVPIAQHV